MVAELPSPNHLTPCSRRAPLPGKMGRNHAGCVFPCFCFCCLWLLCFFVFGLLSIFCVLYISISYFQFPDHRSGVKTRMCVAGGQKKTLEETEEIGMHEMHGMHGMHGMDCKSDRYQNCLEATACYMVIAHGLDHRATSCKQRRMLISVNSLMVQPCLMVFFLGGLLCLQPFVS